MNSISYSRISSINQKEGHSIQRRKMSIIWFTVSSKVNGRKSKRKKTTNKKESGGPRKNRTKI